MGFNQSINDRSGINCVLTDAYQAGNLSPMELTGITAAILHAADNPDDLVRRFGTKSVEVINKLAQELKSGAKR